MLLRKVQTAVLLDYLNLNIKLSNKNILQKWLIAWIYNQVAFTINIICVKVSFHKYWSGQFCETNKIV